MARTRLIVNADDFGLSPAVNEGIARAHREGVVTSASLMTRSHSAADAALEARGMPDLAVGLHVDMGEWEYERGTWRRLYQVVDMDDAQAVAAELECQLEAFRDLIGRDPTHLDSHQHVHREDPLRPLITALGMRLSRPVRHLTPAIQYVGDFYGQSAEGEPFHQAITTEGLIALIGRLPAGIVELACHPATAPDMKGMYRSEREIELATLCHPEVRRALIEADAELLSFREVTGE